MSNILVEKHKMNPHTRNRIRFLRTFINPTPSTCPECEAELIMDDYETYCPDCGLVTSTSIDYVGGVRIQLPYGKK